MTGAPGAMASASATCGAAGCSAAARISAPACSPCASACSVKPATRLRSRSSRRPAPRTNVPRPTPRSTSPWAASDASAWRTVMRLTRSASASSRSAGRRSPSRRAPEAMRSASCSSICTQAGLAARSAGAQLPPNRRVSSVVSVGGMARRAGGRGDTTVRWRRPSRFATKTFAGVRCAPMALLSLDDLRDAATAGRIDTVLLCLADMQGRLQGKRLTARHFLDEVVAHGAEACNYLLAVDVEMNTVGGYEMSSWDRGYGDFEMVPDLSTLRRIPWHEKTALCLADLRWGSEEPVVASPRQILRAQLQRLSERGLEAFAATELEFIIFKDTYEEAFEKGYRGLKPANQHNVDYSLVGTARVEKLIGRIRREMTAAGLVVENSKGECNDGQHEINFRYGPALQTADEHSIYKTGAKEIASLEGMAITFMAKFNEREGSSCHIHMSVE